MSYQDRSCGSVIEKVAVITDPDNKERHVKTAVILKMACALHLSVLDDHTKNPTFESIIGVVMTLKQLIQENKLMTEFFQRSCDESLLELFEQN